MKGNTMNQNNTITINGKVRYDLCRFEIPKFFPGLAFGKDTDVQRTSWSKSGDHYTDWYSIGMLRLAAKLHGVKEVAPAASTKPAFVKPAAQQPKAAAAAPAAAMQDYANLALAIVDALILKGVVKSAKAAKAAPVAANNLPL